MPVPEALTRSFSVEGRVVVITGAASGLGAEATRLFAEAGARVVLADIDDAALEMAVARLRDAGGTALARRTDVAARGQVDALADAAVAEFGAIDLWINSAGITMWATVVEGTQPEADRVVAVNMMGRYWGCAAAARVMKRQERGGAIVNVASLAGQSMTKSDLI